MAPPTRRVLLVMWLAAVGVAAFVCVLLFGREEVLNTLLLRVHHQEEQVAQAQENGVANGNEIQTRSFEQGSLASQGLVVVFSLIPLLLLSLSPSNIISLLSYQM